MTTTDRTAALIALGEWVEKHGEQLQRALNHAEYLALRDADRANGSHADGLRSTAGSWQRLNGRLAALVAAVPAERCEDDHRFGDCVTAVTTTGTTITGYLGYRGVSGERVVRVRKDGETIEIWPLADLTDVRVVKEG